MLLIPRNRISLTSRSCSVLFIRSTRPLACGVLAQMMLMLSTPSARPNLGNAASTAAGAFLVNRKMLCLSL